MDARFRTLAGAGASCFVDRTFGTKLAQWFVAEVGSIEAGEISWGVGTLNNRTIICVLPGRTLYEIQDSVAHVLRNGNSRISEEVTVQVITKSMQEVGYTEKAIDRLFDLLDICQFQSTSAGSPARALVETAGDLQAEQDRDGQRIKVDNSRS